MLVSLFIGLALIGSSISCAAPASAPGPKPAAAVMTREVRAGPHNTVPADTLLRTESYVTEEGRDVLEGPFVEWFPDGKRRLEGSYKHGLLDGPLVEHSPRTGKHIREERWKNGLQDGEFVEFDDDGTKTSQCIYRNGKIIAPKRFFNRRGAMVRETFTMTRENCHRSRSGTITVGRNCRGISAAGIKIRNSSGARPAT